jgi:hypothetical protein
MTWIESFSLPTKNKNATPVSRRSLYWLPFAHWFGLSFVESENRYIDVGHEVIGALAATCYNLKSRSQPFDFVGAIFPLFLSANLHLVAGFTAIPKGPFT